MTSEEIDYMQQLPEHLMDQIINNLPVQELMNMMLLNSTYYEMLTTDSNVSKRIKLAIKEIDIGVTQAILTSERIFETVVAEHLLPDVSKALFFKFGDHVKNLSLNPKISASSVAELLAYTPNLEVLVLDKLTKDVQTFESPSLNKLKILKIAWFWEQGVDHELDLFSKVTTLEKLDVTKFPANFFDGVLLRQPALKELKMKMEYPSTQAQTFFSTDISASPFQLTLFHFIDTFCCSTAIANLTKFLRSQTEIKELLLFMVSYSFWEALNAIIEMKLLRTVNLQFPLPPNNLIAPENAVPLINNNVISLDLSASGWKTIRDIVNYFVGLESLVIRLRDHSEAVEYFSFSHLTKLKHIKFVGSKFGIQELAETFHDLNLKEIELVMPVGVKDIDAWFLLCERNPNITSLSCELIDLDLGVHTLTSERITNDVIEVITKNLKNLEKLQFPGRVQIFDQKTIEIICNNCKNLKELDLNLKGSKEDYYAIIGSSDVLKGITCDFQYKK